jgi:hypothetical protein
MRLITVGNFCPFILVIFPPEKQRFEIGAFSSFYVDFFFHNTKRPGVFVRLVTVAASVITDFKIVDMCILLRWINIISENRLPR